MGKEVASKKKANKEVTGIDKKAYQNIKQEIQDCYSVINKAHDSLCGKFIEMAKILNLRDIKIGTSSEYDDNNYFTETHLSRIFDLEMELKSYDLDEGFSEVIKFLEELEVPHTLNYMEVVISKEDYFASNPDSVQEFKDDFSCNYSEDIIELIQECFKNGIKVDDLQKVSSFLIDVVQAPAAAIPASWEG